MNIKELADIGAKAAYACSIKTKKSNPTELTIDSDSYIYDAKAIVRESFTQAVIDAYEKDKAMSTDKWAKEKEAYKNGLNIEWRRPSDGINTWQIISWLGEPVLHDFNEYRIAPGQETNVADPSEIDRLKAELTAANERIADLEARLKIDKVREAFEKHARGRMLALDRDGESYEDGATVEVWIAWQVATNQAK